MNLYYTKPILLQNRFAVIVKDKICCKLKIDLLISKINCWHYDNNDVDNCSNCIFGELYGKTDGVD